MRQPRLDAEAATFWSRYSPAAADRPRRHRACRSLSRACAQSAKAHSSPLAGEISESETGSVAEWRELPLLAKVFVVIGSAIVLTAQVSAFAVLVSLPLLLAFAVAGGPSSVLDTWWGSDLAAVTALTVAVMTIGIPVHAVAHEPRRHWMDLFFELVSGLWCVGALYIVWRRLFGWALDTGRLAIQIPFVAVMGIGSLLLLVGTVGLPGRIAQLLGRKIRAGPSTPGGWHRVLLSAWPAWVGVGLIAFGTLNAFLLRLGIAEAPKQPRSGVELVSAAVATELISLLQGVPVLEIPDSLRLRPPLAYTDRWTGVNQILFKLAVVVPMIPVAVEAAWNLARRIAPEPDEPDPGDGIVVEPKE
jgi:hypothetical protein